MENRHDWKAHLSNLPIPQDFPKWQSSGDFACLVLPIFSFTQSTEYIERYIAKSAAWSLKTWKENSDARLFNIPCYLYVEAEVADAAIPILIDNGVPKDHILVADYKNTAWLSKCLQPIFDESQLGSYEYIVISDVDMFALRGSKDERLPIFEYIKRFKPTGVGCKVIHEYIPFYWMTNLQHLNEYEGNALEAPLIDVWCETLNAVAGRDDLRQYVDGGSQDDRPWTGVMVIHSDSVKDKAWLEQACKRLGDDESAIYAWSKQSESNYMWDIGGFGIPTYTDIFGYLNVAFAECGWEWSESNKNGLEFKDIYTKDACLMHHFASVDYKFYKTLGVY